MGEIIISKCCDLFQKNKLPFGMAMLCLVGFLMTFQLLINAANEKTHTQGHIDTVNHANVLKTQVDRELNALLFVSSGLSSYLTVYHQNLEKAKVEAILADLYSRTKHVRNLGIAVGYRVTYVYPLKSNEKAVGVDYRNLPKQWPTVKRAVDSRQGVLDGPLNLVQGGRGIIYRFPVFIDNQYWGILSTVINTDSFLDSAFSAVPSEDYQFAIRVKIAQGDDQNVFYGNAALFNDRNALVTTSKVPNGEWEWAILKKPAKTSSLIILARVMGVIISVLLALCVFLFISERSVLTSQAMYDSLTGLANRRLLHDRMGQALAQSKRFGRLMAIMFIDLDHFKRINDIYGHDFGDAVLQHVGKKLAACIRDVDTLSRVGGDEFVIVLEELTQEGDVHIIAEKIISSFAEPITILGKPIQLTISIGIATTFASESETLNSLMKKADIALYEVKGAGRNGYRLWQKD